MLEFFYKDKPNLEWLETVQASNLTIQFLFLSSITSIVYGFFDYWNSSYAFWWSVSTVTSILSAITYYFDVQRKLGRVEARCVPFRNTLYCKYMTILFAESGGIGMLWLHITIMTQYNYLYWYFNGTIIYTIFSCLGFCFQCFVMYLEYDSAYQEWVKYYKINC